MRLVPIFARLRRGVTFVVLGVGLTTLALSLSQCKMVEERLTGVSLYSAKPPLQYTNIQYLIIGPLRKIMSAHPPRLTGHPGT